MAYPNQHIDIEATHSRDHVIESDIVKIRFNLDIESTCKTHSIVKLLQQNLQPRTFSQTLPSRKYC